MALIAGRRELGIKEIGSTTTVANDPRAKLMYYLDCICSLIPDLDSATPKLRDYQLYYLLSEAETDALAAICLLISPDEIFNKIIFLDEDGSVCGESSNKFLSLEQVSHHVLLTESVMIGGQQKQVQKVMFFTKGWLEKNYIEPMTAFTERLVRLANGLRSSRSQRGSNSGCCCTIL